LWINTAGAVMNKLLLSAAALAALAAGGPVLAADMPARPVLKAPPPIAAPTWSGFYIGVGVGFRSTETDWNVTSVTDNGVEVLASECAALANGPCVTGEPLNDTAFRVSPYVGVNWQFAPQGVVGIEADWGSASKTTTLQGMIYPVTPGISTGFSGIAADSISVKTGWDASVRARLGFLPHPAVLLYATGGAAWLRIESTSTCNTAAPSGTCAPGVWAPAVISHAQTKAGWTAGGGLEAMLWSNWIARAEYRYADFGTISNTDTRTFPSLIRVTSYDVAVRTHTVTFGLAYKLDAGPAPVTAYAAAAPILKAPPALVASSWSGPYLGLGTGIRSSKTDASVTRWTDNVTDQLAPCAAIIAAVGGCVFGEPLNDTAWRGSVYGGFNWQFAPQLVGGVEADWGFADKTTTLAGMTYPVNGFFGGRLTDTFSVKTGWDASLRGRIGVLAHPAVLVYATGGAAWLRVESTTVCGFDCDIAPAVITQTHTKAGWTAGVGLEAMLWSNWMVRGEYRYADFGTISNTDTRTAPGFTRIVSYDLDVRTHTMTFGLAYKFDWAAPVVARY
jgi:outer membrane immunogenic protein